MNVVGAFLLGHLIKQRLQYSQVHIEVLLQKLNRIVGSSSP
jgi:hypothetical protein